MTINLRRNFDMSKGVMPKLISFTGLNASFLWRTPLILNVHTSRAYQSFETAPKYNIAYLTSLRKEERNKEKLELMI